jgi:hypothetical protein
MGFYGDHVLPRIIDLACNMKVGREQRQRSAPAWRATSSRSGRLRAERSLLSGGRGASQRAVEPADVASMLASKRLADSTAAVERSGLDGQSLPFPDDSFDSALSTWTICTIRRTTSRPVVVLKGSRPHQARATSTELSANRRTGNGATQTE